MTDTLLLKNAQVIATMDDDNREIENGYILVRNNRVEAVRPPTAPTPQTAP